MEVKLFSLSTFDSIDNVYALGMSIVRDDGDEEAVTFRRDPSSGHSTFAVFSSPEAACTRFSMIVPLRLVWMDGDQNGTAADRTARVCDRTLTLRSRSVSGEV